MMILEAGTQFQPFCEYSVHSYEKGIHFVLIRGIRCPRTHKISDVFYFDGKYGFGYCLNKMIILFGGIRYGYGNSV